MVSTGPRRQQLAAIGAEADVLLEPARRDSGPAIAAGAGYALTRDDGAVVVALAADHVVTDPGGVRQGLHPRPRRRRGGSDRHVRRRADAAGDRVRLHPDRPCARSELFAIERFVEKPDAETAARYLAEGYLWNSGNFMFRARFLLDEYRRFEPDSAAAVAAAVAGASTDLGFVTLGVERVRRAPQRNRSTTR